MPVHALNSRPSVETVKYLQCMEILVLGGFSNNVSNVDKVNRHTGIKLSNGSHNRPTFIDVYFY